MCIGTLIFKHRVEKKKKRTEKTKYIAHSLARAPESLRNISFRRTLTNVSSRCTGKRVRASSHIWIARQQTQTVSSSSFFYLNKPKQLKHRLLVFSSRLTLQRNVFFYSDFTVEFIINLTCHSHRVFLLLYSFNRTVDGCIIDCWMSQFHWDRTVFFLRFKWKDLIWLLEWQFKWMKHFKGVKKCVRMWKILNCHCILIRILFNFIVYAFIHVSTPIETVFFVCHRNCAPQFLKSNNFHIRFT